MTSIPHNNPPKGFNNKQVDDRDYYQNTTGRFLWNAKGPPRSNFLGQKNFQCKQHFRRLSSSKSIELRAPNPFGDSFKCFTKDLLQNLTTCDRIPKLSAGPVCLDCCYTGIFVAGAVQPVVHCPTAHHASCMQMWCGMSISDTNNAVHKHVRLPHCKAPDPLPPIRAPQPWAVGGGQKVGGWGPKFTPLRPLPPQSRRKGLGWLGGGSCVDTRTPPPRAPPIHQLRPVSHLQNQATAPAILKVRAKEWNVLKWYLVAHGSKVDFGLIYII